MGKRNYKEMMEIDDSGSNSGSAMMMVERKKKRKKKEEPKRISEIALEWQEYRLKWRAADAANKLVAARHREELHKWRTMSKARLIQEELFFSKDIDFSRMNLSDAPARPARASGKANIKPAGRATSPPGIKLSSTPGQWDLVSDKQLLQPAPAGGVISPVPSFPNKD